MMRTLAIAILVSLSACDSRDAPVPYQGHIEGEYVYVAPLDMARHRRRARKHGLFPCHPSRRQRTRSPRASRNRRGRVRGAVPVGFSTELMPGDRPQLLIEADATDPAAAGNALNAAQQLDTVALREELKGALSTLQAGPPPFELMLHRLYNPEGITAYNIVPGLIGVILTMSTTLMTALALTRETERGTMENLLSMPVRPVEVMLGKIVPYIGIGFIQVIIRQAGTKSA